VNSALLVSQSLPASSYPSIAGLVLIGSIVPVIPTGAVVSAGAAAASTHAGLFAVALVVGVSTIGAFLGDLATFALCRTFGDRALRLLRIDRTKPNHAERLATAEKRLIDHRIAVLVIARLIPAGRIPILVAAGLMGVPWKAFCPAQLLAALIWAVLYSALGLAGGSAFTEPWKAVLAALVFVVVLSGLTSLGQRLWRRYRD
jgi:membrane protein DedA with SNARE-associated domain